MSIKTFNKTILSFSHYHNDMSSDHSNKFVSDGVLKLSTCIKMILKHCFKDKPTTIMVAEYVYAQDELPSGLYYPALIIEEERDDVPSKDVITTLKVLFVESFVWVIIFTQAMFLSIIKLIIWL